MPLAAGCILSAALASIWFFIAGDQEDQGILYLVFDSAGIIFYIGKPIHKAVNIEEIKGSKDDILLIVEDRPTAHLKEELESTFRPVKRGKI